MNATAWELVQFNLAELAAPLDSLELADFVAALDRLNALAEQSRGFRWRLQGEGGNATGLRPLGEHVLVNCSVWSDAAALRDYVYRAEHGAFLRRRREWFREPAGPVLVLWWTTAGARPTIEEGLQRLERLRTEGPGPEAFTFARLFPPPQPV